MAKEASALNQPCSMCRKVRDEGRDEDMCVTSKSTKVVVCAECAANVVLLVYSAGGRLALLEEELSSLFLISSTAEDRILREQGEMLAERYQAKLLAAREPDADDRPHGMSVLVTTHMHDKIKALSGELSISASEWIRRAILLAFEATKAH